MTFLDSQFPFFKKSESSSVSHPIV